MVSYQSHKLVLGVRLPPPLPDIAGEVFVVTRLPSKQK